MAAAPQAIVNQLASGGSVVPLAVTPTSLQGDYWVGQDGNLYVKAAGVQGANGAPVDNLGKNSSVLDTSLAGLGAKQISDPAVPPAPTGGGSTGGGGTTSSGGGHLPQSTIDAVMQSIANSIADAQGKYQNALNADNQYQANGDTQYEAAAANNREGRAQAFQQAEQAGAQGLQGLDAVLASLGALNGTGSILAGRAVANTTNNDVGSANQTFKTNDQTIQQEKGAYDTTYDQARTNLANALDTDTKQARATGYQQLLDQASSLGDTSLFQKYLPLAVANTAPTQQFSPTIAPIAQSSLATYGAGSPLTVKANNPTTTPIAPAAGLTPANSALSITKDNS